MEISIRQTNLKPTSIRTLLANGIVLVSHLNTFDVPRLASKTKLSIDECERILAATKPKRPHFVIKASDLIARRSERITTNISDLDAILDGGIKCGQLTEISGEAGAGKSNLCSEIGVRVMLPREFKGLNSKVMLIHTEGHGKMILALRRFNQLVESVIPEYEEITRTKLHVKDCYNEVELIELINRLPEILNDMPEVKLIIIDSITCAFIQVEGDIGYEFYARRDMKLTKLAKILLEVASQHQVAVVLTNHVAFDVKAGLNKPALGKVWSHICQTKIYIERVNSGQIARFAHVTKGAHKLAEPVRFDISKQLFD